MVIVYKTGAELIENHKDLLEANPLESGFFYLDATFLPSTNKQNFAIAAVEGERALLCMKVIPYNIILLGDSSLLKELFTFLLQEEYEVESVLCNEQLGEKLCPLMKELRDIPYYEALAMDYMECYTSYKPSNPAVCCPSLSDAQEILQCMNLFAEECGLEERHSLTEIETAISRYRIIRAQGQIASMAAMNDDTESRKRISCVYTRPPFRGQGMAEDTVNALVNEILINGLVPDLNVDQRNPVTNYLYRKIGFQAIFSQGQYRPALVETERLHIRALSESEIEALIAQESSQEMISAYGEMLTAVRANPKDWVFVAPWIMERRSDGVLVGDIGFKGVKKDGSIEISYGLYNSFCNQGYMTEAVQAMVAWAMEQGSVKRIEAETQADNFASQRVLEKAGFVPMGEQGAEGPRFVWRKKD